MSAHVQVDDQGRRIRALHPPDNALLDAKSVYVVR